METSEEWCEGGADREDRDICEVERLDDERVRFDRKEREDVMEDREDEDTEDEGAAEVAPLTLTRLEVG